MPEAMLTLVALPIPHQTQYFPVLSLLFNADEEKESRSHKCLHGRAKSSGVLWVGLKYVHEGFARAFWVL